MPGRTAPDEMNLAAPAGARPSILTRAWPALPAIAVLVFVLVRLGFTDGGYFPAAFTAAAAIAFIAIAVLVVLVVLVVRPPAPHRSPAALTAAGALAGYAAWSGVSGIWSVVPDAPLLDMQRAMLYVALFCLALLGVQAGRHARLLIWSLFGVIVAIAVAGLLSRLRPALVGSQVDPIVAVFYRLDHPLGYWNALGALASMGCVLAVGLAADVRSHAGLRAMAAGAAVVLTVTMYLSLSRGAWLALLVGVAVLVAFAPGRGTLLATLAIVGGTVTIAILRLRGYPALVVDPRAGGGQAAEGGAFARELLVLLAGAIGAQAALATFRPGARLSRRQRARARRALNAVAGLAALAAVVAYGVAANSIEGHAARFADDATGWIDRQWQDFLIPTGNAGAAGTGDARLVSTAGARSDLYRVAIDGFRARPLIGGGAGSFEVRYARERRAELKVRDAHSLVLQTLSELGAVGLLLLAAFVGAVAHSARRALGGRSALRPAEAAAVVAACAVWLSHASIDWDWEMPAVTGIAVVLAATLFAPGRRRRSAAPPAGTAPDPAPS